jgi:formylglycine-generating enzyme required for sulfatase activity
VGPAACPGVVQRRQLLRGADDLRIRQPLSVRGLHRSGDVSAAHPASVRCACEHSWKRGEHRLLPACGDGSVMAIGHSKLRIASVLPVVCLASWAGACCSSNGSTDGGVQETRVEDGAGPEAGIEEAGPPEDAVQDAVDIAAELPADGADIQAAPACGLLGVGCPAGFECTAQTVHAIGNGIDAWCYSAAEESVFVPAGPAWLGCNTDKSELCFSWSSWPKQAKFNPHAFAIMQFPVTIAEYQTCFDAGFPGCDAATGPGTVLDARNWTTPDNAVVVSWLQARAYCEWTAERLNAAWRLCSEIEWDKAMHGGCETLGGQAATDDVYCAQEGRLWPWGNAQPSCDLMFIGGVCPGPPNPFVEPDPVGTRRGSASAYGAMDALNFDPNWVQDCVVEQQSKLPPDGSADESSCKGQPDAETARIVRGPGGHYYFPSAFGRTWKRASDQAGTIRCCRDM